MISARVKIVLLGIDLLKKNEKGRKKKGGDLLSCLHDGPPDRAKKKGKKKKRRSLGKCRSQLSNCGKKERGKKRGGGEEEKSSDQRFVIPSRHIGGTEKMEKGKGNEKPAPVSLSPVQTIPARQTEGGGKKGEKGGKEGKKKKGRVLGLSCSRPAPPRLGECGRRDRRRTKRGGKEGNIIIS